MNDFFIILIKTTVFIFCYITVSKALLKYVKRRNNSADYHDAEIIVISVIGSAVVTSIVKYIIRIFI